MFNDSFSENLRTLMSETKMSQEHIAKAIGLPKATLLSYLKGAKPNIENVILIADYFAVPLDFLLGRCSKEQADSILNDYSKHFMSLRRASFESYFYGRHKLPIEFYEDNYESPYPYNLLDCINAAYGLGTYPIDWEVRPETRKGLEWALNTLLEREKAITLAYFENGKTLEEIASQYNLTRERIRQIILKSIRKLRHPAMKKAIFKGYHSIKEIDNYFEEKTKDLNREEIRLKKKENEILKKEKCIEEWINKIKTQSIHNRSALINLEDLSYELNRIDENIEFDIPIEKLGLSVRSFNVLKRGGIAYISDIVKKLRENPTSIFKLRNMGRKSYDNVLDKLDEYLNTGIYYSTTYAIDKIID